MALNDVPRPGQSLGVTRNPVRLNFINIGAGFSFDHVDFNTPNAGKHNKITYPVQAVSPVFVGTDIGSWSEVMPATGVPEIWIANSNGNVYPSTASILSYTPSAANYTSGWTYLPSGVLIKWGTTGAGSLINIDLTNAGPAGGPNFAAVFIAQLTPYTSNTFAQVGQLIPSNLRVLANSTAPIPTVLVDCFWMVIGRQ